MILSMLRGGDDTHDDHHEAETLNEWILHHLQDTDKWLGAKLPTLPTVELGPLTIDFSITSNVVMLWIGSAILIAMFWLVFRAPKQVPSGMANALESLVLFVRDEIAIPNLGKSLGLQLTPFLCSMFFFILVLNLMGLVPVFTSATGNIAFTAAMAGVSFIVTQYYGFKKNGVKGYFAHFFPSGVPAPLYLILSPIEFLGIFIKPFVLCMRLFANMVAGHTVIYAIVGLIIVLQSVWVSFAAIPLALALNLLELFVAFLQAYIFVILTALFIGMAADHAH